MFLNCHSTYSLRYGTLSPKMLVERAQKLGIKQLVLTDINNTSAAVEFYISCRAANIKPIIGIEFRKNNKTLYIGIAHNIRGFKSLNDYYTSIQYGEREMDFYAPRLDDVYIIYPYLVKPIEDFREEEFLGIRPQYLHRLFRSTVKKRMDRLVVLHSVTFANQQGYELHKILRAIDYNCLISQLTQKDIAHPNEILLSSEDAIKPYAAYPQIVANTQRLLNKCEIVLKQGFSLNRQYFSKSPKDDLALLKKLAHKGCKRRYGEDHYGAFERLSQELKVIEKQSFTSYFLITWDIIRYAQISGYYHVGRGSGANSIVAYCLYITDVDPLELDLYFERFINPYRISPPDFDIDFSWDERDDVTEYIFDRYGREYVALLATYVTFSGRSIIREIGKVYGLPKEEIDKIISGQVSLEQMHPQWKKIRQYGSMMEGIPNYLSIHAGGVLISERPLAYSSALEMMPKGFPVVHFDMHHAEDWGYHKYDILSQRGLGHIKDAVSLVKSNQGKSVDIRDISKIKSDARVRDKLREGQCLGCFYIESPAMRGLLSKLRCDRYIDLVAASSIIRPGVAKSGMMRAYIERYHAPYSFEYLHPVFEEHLGETFGVMVYQEDVMKIAHHFAGLDLDESDVLRRLMSGKKTKGDTFERLKQKFFDNCALKQHDIKLSEEVWRQIESFAGYSFCKAHSASYAVESMQSLYLKTYFPVEFMVAVINNFGGFYRTQYYLHEAYMSGAVLHPPCVNHSELLTGLEGRDVYLGFGLIDSLERTTIKKYSLKGANQVSTSRFQILCAEF